MSSFPVKVLIKELLPDPVTPITAIRITLGSLLGPLNVLAISAAYDSMVGE